MTLNFLNVTAAFAQIGVFMNKSEELQYVSSYACYDSSALADFVETNIHCITGATRKWNSAPAQQKQKLIKNIYEYTLHTVTSFLYTGEVLNYQLIIMLWVQDKIFLYVHCDICILHSLIDMLITTVYQLKLYLL